MTEPAVVPETSELPLERLEAEITELAADIWAATSRWLGLVAEFDRREGWASWGCRSCAHWLSWRCGVALNAAREKVRVARKLEDLPDISEAFSRGELSYSKVRALTR
ncbi:MAG: 13E12 repeat family protein, partial [Actinomycetota bacterium]|nr:13E12 repeat family protein [Actinomycetota bacterium]